MKKSQEIIKYATTLVGSDQCVVIYTCEVEKFRGEKEKCDNRILLLTNLSLYLFKPSKRSKPISNDYWYELIGVKGLFEEGSIIELFFKNGNIKFRVIEDREVKTLKLKLGDLFQRIFTKKEQEMRGLLKKDLYKIACHSIQNSFGQYSRFLSYVKSNNIEIDKKTETRFFKYITYRQNEITFPKNIKANEFEPFMYGIDALTFVESIIFKKFANIDIFKQLVAFYTTMFENPLYIMNEEEKTNSSPNNQVEETYQFHINSNIRHLKFQGLKMSNNFDDFITCLTNGTILHQVTGLSFEGVELIENDFFLIDKFCRSVNSKKVGNSSVIKSLSFNYSLDESDYNYFLSSFLNIEMTRHLLMLSLNGAVNIQVPILLDKIRNIASLSLADCNINILNALRCISRSGMDNLRMLNLSGNFCSKETFADPNAGRGKGRFGKKKKKELPLNGDVYNPDDVNDFEPDDIVIPESLNVLYVRNVRWGLRYKALVAFLQAASSFKPRGQFRLSIRGIRGGTYCDEEGGNDNDSESQNTFNSSLDHFNELNSYLVGFFTSAEKCNITHLDWAGNPVSPEFVSFLAKAKQLVDLDVSFCFSAELEDKNEDCDATKYDYRKDSQTSEFTVFKLFCEYLINDAKKLKSLVICGKVATAAKDQRFKKKKGANLNDEKTLSQNLSNNTIFPLFQAIKETKNPLSYVNISGQSLQIPQGFNFFSDAIAANQNIQKVSFKNTGFNSKDQFHYFVSKVKQKDQIVVEWPSEEMKNLKDENICHYKNLLIKLSDKNLYYEDPNNKPSKPSKPAKKSKKKKNEDNTSNSDENNDEEIIYDKLIYGKNMMTRKIECFQFDVEKKFPIYFSREVEEFLSLPTDTVEQKDDEVKPKNKKEIKKKNSNEVQERKVDIIEYDDENNSDDDDEKVAMKKKKPKKKIDDDDDDVVDLRKKKYLLNKSERKNDEDDEDDDSDRKSKKSIKKRNVSLSSDSEEKDVIKFKFPRGIVPNENDEENLIKKIKDKFSLENLMNDLVNG